MTRIGHSAGQSPIEREFQCALRSQSLRHAAEAATPLQAEHAIVQYGAGAALERAAVAWSRQERDVAQAWERGAESQLLLALGCVPWLLTSCPG